MRYSSPYAISHASPEAWSIDASSNAASAVRVDESATASEFSTPRANIPVPDDSAVARVGRYVQGLGAHAGTSASPPMSVAQASSHAACDVMAAMMTTATLGECATVIALTEQMCDVTDSVLPQEQPSKDDGASGGNVMAALMEAHLLMSRWIGFICVRAESLRNF